jgi:hypothetical protein
MIENAPVTCVRLVKEASTAIIHPMDNAIVDDAMVTPRDLNVVIS